MILVFKTEITVDTSYHNDLYGGSEKSYVLPEDLGDFENYVHKVAETDDEVVILSATNLRTINEQTDPFSLVDVLSEFGTFEEMVLHYLNVDTMENQLYEMVELDDVLMDYSATDIALAIGKGFSVHDPYFAFNGSGNLESYDEEGREEYLFGYLEQALEYYL